jgi:hypothetical protein
MTAQQTAFDFASPPSPPGAAVVSAELRLERALRVCLGAEIALALTDNTRVMISARVRAGITHVRLHHMFVDADDETLRAVARFLSEGQRKTCQVLQRFIESRGARIHPPRKPARKAASASRRTQAVSSRITRAREVSGRHHDLEQIYRDINARYFETAVEACIGWARMARGLGRRQKRRSIKLGSYMGRLRSIRIHPVLDAGWVPRFFVEYIVYHEMLHDVIGMPVKNGRRRLHGPDFRARERMFEHYAEAIAWERDNVDRLLSG